MAIRLDRLRGSLCRAETALWCSPSCATLGKHDHKKCRQKQPSPAKQASPFLSVFPDPGWLEKASHWNSGHLRLIPASDKGDGSHPSTPPHPGCCAKPLEHSFNLLCHASVVARGWGCLPHSGSSSSVPTAMMLPLSPQGLTPSAFPIALYSAPGDKALPSPSSTGTHSWAGFC